MKIVEIYLMCSLCIFKHHNTKSKKCNHIYQKTLMK